MAHMQALMQTFEIFEMEGGHQGPTPCDTCFPYGSYAGPYADLKFLKWRVQIFSYSVKGVQMLRKYRFRGKNLGV